MRAATHTAITDQLYDPLLGANATARDRLKMDAYLLGGLTEFFRAYRSYAGVLHFVYLTSCYPGAYTCDNFQDVAALKLHPEVADYVGEAFKPPSAYINFWHPNLPAKQDHDFALIAVHYDQRQAR